MSRKSFYDALCDIAQIKSLEKFTKTRQMVRSGQDITSLSMSELSKNGLLNPWILNIQEVIISTFFSGIFAVAFMYIIGAFLNSESLKEVFTPTISQAGVFLYIFIATYILVYASVPFKYLSNKENKETIINSFLYVNGSYGFTQKFTAGFAASLLYHVSHAFQYLVYESDIEKVLFLFYLSFLLIITSMVMEYFNITRNITRYQPLSKYNVSSTKLKLAAFFLIALPSLALSSYSIFHFTVGFFKISSRADRIIALYSSIFGILLIIGIILFFETKRKANILKFSLVSSIFLKLPGCTSSPKSISDAYNETSTSAVGGGQDFSSIVHDLINDTTIGVIIECSFNKCSHSYPAIFILYGVLVISTCSFYSYLYFACKMAAVSGRKFLFMRK